MSKTVVFSTCVQLSCAKDSTPDVILCLCCSDLLAPKKCHDDTTDMPYAFTTLPAVLVKSYRENDTCGGCGVFRYFFTYDENLLADPTTPLTVDQVTGVFCKDCLTTWIEDEVGNECYFRDNGDGTITFVSQHGCEYTFTGALI